MYRRRRHRLNRDEAGLIGLALGQAGLHFKPEQQGGFHSATFQATNDLFPKGTVFDVDAPPGWLRLATVLKAPPSAGKLELSDDVLRSYNTLVCETGFAVVQWDARVPGLRVCVHLQAATQPPMGSAVRAAVSHILAVCAKLEGADLDIAHKADPGIPDLTTLPDAVLALGAHVPFAWQVDGTFQGEVADGQGAPVLLRAHTMRPGVFAFEAELGTPAQQGSGLQPWLHALNAGTITGGSVIQSSDGGTAYLWTTPYEWLQTDELATGWLAKTASWVASKVRYPG